MAKNNQLKISPTLLQIIEQNIQSFFYKINKSHP